MSAPNRDPHFFDCPSCKAFATLRLFGRGRRAKAAEKAVAYECEQCHAQFPADALERESAKRAVEE